MVVINNQYFSIRRHFNNKHDIRIVLGTDESSLSSMPGTPIITIFSGQVSGIYDLEVSGDVRNIAVESRLESVRKCWSSRYNFADISCAAEDATFFRFAVANFACLLTLCRESPKHTNIQIGRKRDYCTIQFCHSGFTLQHMHITIRHPLSELV